MFDDLYLVGLLVVDLVLC